MDKSVAIIGTRGYPSYYGGFETLVRRLAPYLADQGWSVTVYGRNGATNADDPDIDSRVARVTTSGIESKSLSTLSYGLTSTLHATRKPPDVALVMNVANGYWLPLLKVRKIPAVVNVDGIEWERAKWGRAAKAVFRTGARLTATLSTRLICDSREIDRRWNHTFGRGGDFIPYGADDPGSLPVEAGLESGKYVLFVARFVPENTVAEFISAAEAISRDWDVVIVGSSGYGGPLEERVEALGKRNPRVRWLGHLSDDRRLFSLWKHAGAYFHGHSVGGTNPALVQAMACGAATVARDTVYNREVLGAAGLFVEADPVAIGKEIDKLMRNHQLGASLSAAASARSKSEYTWDIVCNRYEESLFRAISRELS